LRPGTVEAEIMSTTSGRQLTFLFTDIEASTRRWESEPEAMASSLTVHDQVVRSAIEGNGGRVFKHTGDGMCAVFDRPGDAVEAAVETQRSLARQQWAVSEPLRARIGAHVGEAIATDGDYFGPALSRTARVMSAGSGGQILLTAAVVGAAELTDDGISFVDRGQHALRDLNGVERLFQVAADGLDADFPPLRVLSAYRHNLPTRSAPLLGRFDDVQQVTGLVRSRRLVTLTGPGGCGKTSLALRVAADVLPERTGGVWVADLTSLEDPRFVARSLATSLGHGERLLGDTEADQDGILRQLVRLVDNDAPLLVVDNCEHVVDAVALCVGALLAGCPELRVLATSREALRVPGEQLFPVPALRLPEAGSSADQVLSSAAGELFSVRAAEVQPGFRVDDDNAAAIASICRRLDGLPLALELAAARVRMLTPQQIDARLADSLRLLGDAGRAAVPRHRTLTATLEWSHDLLTAREMAVFRRLAVFSGGFTIDAVEQVCTDELVDDLEVFECLSSLVDRSLVVPPDDDRSRFRLLEVVRQFAERQLDATGDRAATQRRHFEWALGLAQRAAPVERISGTWQLVDEAPNLRAAMTSARDSSAVDGDERLLLAYTLWRYMLESGRIPEGLVWLDEALAGRETEGTLLEARALDAAGFLRSLRGDFDTARTQVRRSLELCRDLGDELSTAWTLLRFGLVCGVQGAVDDSSSPFAESLEIFRRLDDPAGTVWAHLETGRALFAGDEIVAAEQQLAAAVAVGSNLDESARRYARAGLAACRLMLGDDQIDELSEALVHLEALGMLYTSTQALMSACAATIDCGAWDAAVDYAGRALAITHRSGGVTQSVHALEWASLALSGRGDVDRAVPLFEYALSERVRLGSIVPPLVVRLEQRVAGELFAAITDRGRVGRSGSQLMLDDVVRLARASTVIETTAA